MEIYMLNIQHLVILMEMKLIMLNTLSQTQHMVITNADETLYVRFPSVCLLNNGLIKKLYFAHEGNRGRWVKLN